jgi:hypothetical protein
MIETRRLDIIIPVCRTRSSFPGGGFFGASLFFPATIVFTRLRTQPVAAPELVT